MPFRPFRRKRPAFNRPGLQANPLLQTANNLLASGHPGEAATLFSQLAHQMETKGQAIRAANLHARAAHAFADSNAEEKSLAEARLAMAQFKALNLTDRMPVFYRNITRKFRNRGMHQALRILEGEFGARLTMPLSSTDLPLGDTPAILPDECPHCGAPVLDTAIEWIDSGRVRCEYCGGIITEQSK